mmetsp:Transcript_11210/g.21091  ORF Transcript_11210/g.21091 Transcript_11210/m.21091 type:complete len:147 (-) Transcript_11210:38-478(-)
MATTSKSGALPASRAALWASPQRIAFAVVAAASMSAALLALSPQPAERPGLLHKDASPVVVPQPPGSLMRREPKESASAAGTADHPRLMRKEPQEPATMAKGRGGSAMYVAAVFAALAIVSFGQQLRSAWALLLQGSSVNDVVKKQ